GCKRDLHFDNQSPTFVSELLVLTAISANTHTFASRPCSFFARRRFPTLKRDPLEMGARPLTPSKCPCRRLSSSSSEPTIPTGTRVSFSSSRSPPTLHAWAARTSSALV